MTQQLVLVDADDQHEVPNLLWTCRSSVKTGVQAAAVALT